MDASHSVSGHDFEMEVFTPRFGGTVDRYLMRHEASGWFVEHLSFSGHCDRTGEPVLYASFRHDGIRWPDRVPTAPWRLWSDAHAGQLTAAAVQEQLADIAGIVNAENKPRRRRGAVRSSRTLSSPRSIRSRR